MMKQDDSHDDDDEDEELDDGDHQLKTDPNADEAGISLLNANQKNNAEERNYELKIHKYSRNESSTM